MGRTALVTGGTGLVGQYLLILLQGDDRYEKVYSIVRSKGELELEKIEELIIDFDSPDIPDISVDDVFCALGTTRAKAGSKEAFYQVDHDYVLLTAELGKHAGASNFAMVSSMGAKTDTMNFYLKVKGETERDIAAMGFANTIILRPSLLLGPRKERRPLERIGEIILSLLRPLMVGRLSRFIPVHASKVAVAMIDSLNTPHAIGSPESSKVVRYVDSNRIRTYKKLKKRHAGK